MFSHHLGRRSKCSKATSLPSHVTIAKVSSQLLSVVITLLSLTQLAHAQGLDGAAARRKAELDSLELRQASLQRISCIAAQGSMIVELQLGDATVTLDLQADTLRAADFEVLVPQADGSLQPVPAPTITTVRGSLVEFPDSEVRGALIEGKLRAVIHTASGSWGVQPVEEAQYADEHWVYRQQDILPGTECCGVAATTLGAPVIPDPGPSFVGSTGPGEELLVAQVAVDVDYEFYQLHGEDLDATVNDVEEILFQMAPAYEALGILHEITSIIVRTNPIDPYSSTVPSALLSQFQSTWNSQPELSIPRDVAHLFTGKELNGPVVGIAHLSSVCVSSNAYGLSQSLFSSNLLLRTAVTAHELAHNWSATHCDGSSGCSIMCSSVASCEALNPLGFGGVAANQILQYKNSIECLAPAGPGLQLPFVETFPELTVDSGKWSEWSQIAVSNEATHEPSAPYSLRLQGAAVGESEIVSRVMDLSAVQDPIIALRIKTVGVDPSHSLNIEYRQSDESWTGFQLVAQGLETLEFRALPLPIFGDAMHSGFRLRLRVSFGEFGSWFVDDVLVLESAGNPSVFVRGDANGDGVVEFTDVIRLLEVFFLQAEAPPCDDVIDVNDDGQLSLGDALTAVIFLFLGGAPPQQPFPFPGPDFSEDALSCPPAY